MANRPLKHPKMHFSPKAPEERFSFGHILTREVTWTIKNQVPTLLMHLDPEGCYGGYTMIPIGRYGQPNPVMRASSMVEHHIMREKKLKIH